MSRNGAAIHFTHNCFYVKNRAFPWLPKNTVKQWSDEMSLFLFLFFFIFMRLFIMRLHSVYNIIILIIICLYIIVQNDIVTGMS